MKIPLVMKRIVIAIGVVISAAAATIVFGQIGTEGVIAYEVKINIHRTLPPDRQDMKDHIPEYRVMKHQLCFNNTESLYTPVVEDEEDDADFGRGGPGGPGGGRMRFRGPRADYYVNQSNTQILIRREMMGKYYLIEDTLKIAAWKFGKEIRSVVGYECKKAMYYDSLRKQDIVAWYAPALKPFLGPELFNTLPGAVLEVNVNDGERVITAKNIDLRPLKKNELKVPSQGTRINQAGFRKVMEQQTERMRGNGGSMIIRN
jgi:GLPGLI family protein